MRDVHGTPLRHKPTKFVKGVERRFQACWVDGGAVVSCGHQHRTVIDAVDCGPLGRFVRAVYKGMWHEVTPREKTC